MPAAFSIPPPTKRSIASRSPPCTLRRVLRRIGGPFSATGTGNIRYGATGRDSFFPTCGRDALQPDTRRADGGDGPYRAPATRCRRACPGGRGVVSREPTGERRTARGTRALVEDGGWDDVRATHSEPRSVTIHPPRHHQGGAARVRRLVCTCARRGRADPRPLRGRPWRRCMKCGHGRLARVAVSWTFGPLRAGSVFPGFPRSQPRREFGGEAAFVVEGRQEHCPIRPRCSCPDNRR